MNVNIDYKKLESIYGNSLIFVGFDYTDYELFISKLSDTNIKYYCPTSLEEFVNIVNSCKMFIGGLSAPLAIAFAVHKRCIIDLHNSADCNHFINLKNYLYYIQNN